MQPYHEVHLQDKDEISNLYSEAQRRLLDSRIIILNSHEHKTPHLCCVHRPMVLFNGDFEETSLVKLFDSYRH